MNNRENHIEELIAKHLAGESSPAEEMELNSWLAENENNHNYFLSLEKIYKESASLKNKVEVDTDAAWNKLKDKISKQTVEEKSIHSFSPINFNRKLIRIAAMILLIAGIGITVYLQTKPEFKPVLISSGDSTKDFMLPDSSTVFLNKNSSILYTFTGSKREIEMNGEAYFVVVHNSSRPFIVKAGELEVRDIGTAFNVNAMHNDNIEVLVEEGEVELRSESVAPINLTKGERSIYHKSDHTITKLSVNDVNAMAYRTKIFVFENASLSSVIQKLNEVYNSDIHLKDNLKECRLTATFKNEKINTIVEIIAETLQLHISRNNNQLTLEGTSCEK